MRVRALHHLPVHLQDQAQHAMRRRVLRAEVDGVVVDLDHLGGAGLVLIRRGRMGAVEAMGADTVGHHLLSLMATVPAAAAFWRSVWAFSSPGSVTMPSQGDTKSKFRKSCVSVTCSFTTRF